MIEDLKRSLKSHLKVATNHKEEYNKNILYAIDNGDKILSNLYKREVSFYEGREQLINTLLEEISILEQREQDEFELALSEAPYVYEIPIEVQI